MARVGYHLISKYLTLLLVSLLLVPKKLGAIDILARALDQYADFHTKKNSPTTTSTKDKILGILESKVHIPTKREWRA